MPTGLVQGQSTQYGQTIDLKQPEQTLDSSKLTPYIQELKNLLMNASSGQSPSYQLPQLYQNIASSNYGSPKPDIANALYLTLESKLKRAPDTLHKDDVAIAILATIAQNQGVLFNSLNNFYDAQSNLIRQLRVLFNDKNYTNNQINTAFKELLRNGYVAQGQRKDGTLVLAATSKIDQYLK